MPTPPRKSDLHHLAERAMRERGLLPDFSPEVFAEMRAITGPARGDGPAVLDLRDLLWCSIDNDDSRDLDQLSVSEPLAGGAARIFVAIADVDSLVEEGSAIDRHARTNTTSVYTAAGVFPMLPERLSTDLTSLNEGEERLAVVVEMEIDADGSVGESEIYRALVRSRAKLAYNSIAAWLEGEGPAPAKLSAVPGLEENLRLQDRIAQAMNRLRHRRGALSLETPTARPVFDGDVLADLEGDEKNRAKQLIEDFMIAANGATARFLEKKRFPSLRRVLHSPERWGRIVLLADGNLPPEPDAAALEEFLVERRENDPGRFADLSLSVVKLLGAGSYQLELPGEDTSGHFGLAVKDYTHSTAPNRRYPDLLTQRLLKAALAGAPVPYSHEELGELARHCTRQEDNAAKVERQVRKSAAALLLYNRIGEEFSAVVTGASDKGTWVRILKPPVEGKVVHGAKGLDVGDKVRVKLVETDVERGFIDFVRVG